MRNASDAILGCFSPSACRSSGLIASSWPAYTGGACFAKKSVRNAMHVTCRVAEFARDDADRTAFALEMICADWLARHPGSTVRSLWRSEKPASSVAGAVFGDLIWPSRAFASEGTWDCSKVYGVSSTSMPSSRLRFPPTVYSALLCGVPPYTPVWLRRMPYVDQTSSRTVSSRSPKREMRTGETSL